ALAVVEGSDTSLDTIAIYELSTGQKRLAFSPGRAVTALAFSPDGRLLASGHRDGTGLIWDLDCPAWQGSRKTPEQLWHDLASRDARLAYRALLALERFPAQAVRLARTHVRPARGKPLAASEISRLIGQLESDDFAVRHRAETILKAHF